MHSEDHFKEVYRLGIAQVRACDCGMLHLGIGPVTVKLTAEAFAQVLSAMQGAQAKLGEAAAKPAAAQPPLRLVESSLQGARSLRPPA